MLQEYSVRKKIDESIKYGYTSETDRKVPEQCRVSNLVQSQIKKNENLSDISSFRVGVVDSVDTSGKLTQHSKWQYSQEGGKFSSDGYFCVTYFNSIWDAAAPNAPKSIPIADGSLDISKPENFIFGKTLSDIDAEMLTRYNDDGVVNPTFDTRRINMGSYMAQEYHHFDELPANCVAAVYGNATPNNTYVCPKGQSQTLKSEIRSQTFNELVMFSSLFFCLVVYVTIIMFALHKCIFHLVDGHHLDGVQQLQTMLPNVQAL
jgi:hypothetical protein